MRPARLPLWLLIAAVLAPIAGALVWLQLIYAGDQSGVERLPDAAVAAMTDAGGQLTWEQVRRLPSSAWQPVPGARFYRAARGNALWLRVTLRNSSDRTMSGVLHDRYLYADRVDAWAQPADATNEPPGGAWRHLRSGEALPAKQRAIAGREVAFPIAVPARSERAVYLRAQDYFSTFMRPVWWPDHADFFVAREREMLADGCYFGGLLALLGYNVLLWLRLRQTDIGYYVLYLGANLIFTLIVRALPPALGAAWGSPLLETLLTVAMAMNGFFLIQFARSFLELRVLAPRADRTARWTGFGLLALATGSVSMAWGVHQWIMAVVVVIGATHLGLFGLAVWAWRAGSRAARFFTLSFGCLLASSLVMVLAWLSHTDVQGADVRAFLIGSAVEMLLLSLAVADRFARAQQEKTLAQERLIAETEQRRFVEETYAEELAEEVRDRTRELEQANADKDRMLAVLGHDLRSPLTGLTRAADEAPGAFPREVARTGRALLLLIEDLVLWARLRAGSKAIAPHPARALLLPAVALHHAVAEHGGIELQVDVPDDLRVATDLVLAQTLVRNLLANALKFAHTRVTLRAEAAPDGGVRFAVGNDGPALPVAVAARIAADEDGPMTATGGLGLRLCREICRALGLKLEGCAPPAGGSEFSFTIKAAPLAAALPR
jgi:signal transduction histidine kinase